MNNLIFSKPVSLEKEDYEVLIRRRSENDYASYCPQLNYMIKGNDHEEVRTKMVSYIENYIHNLTLPDPDTPNSSLLEHST